MSPADGTEVPSDLDLAHFRADDAYREARSLVFDEHPHGDVPPPGRLTALQRDALADLADAEAEVERLRRDGPIG